MITVILSSTMLRIGSFTQATTVTGSVASVLRFTKTYRTNSQNMTLVLQENLEDTATLHYEAQDNLKIIIEKIQEDIDMTGFDNEIGIPLTRLSFNIKKMQNHLDVCRCLARDLL